MACRIEQVGWYIFPFALGNVLGPLAARAAVRQDRPQADDRRDLCCRRAAARALRRFCSPRVLLDARGQTIAWMIVFFFASAAASAAYLTVSEIFPVEIRALAIAAFYAFGTAIGGVAAPALFGALIATGKRGVRHARLSYGRGSDARLRPSSKLFSASPRKASRSSRLLSPCRRRAAEALVRHAFGGPLAYHSRARTFDKPHDHAAQAAHILFGELHAVKHVAQIVLHHRPLGQRAERSRRAPTRLRDSRRRREPSRAARPASVPGGKRRARRRASPSSIHSR